MAQPQPRNFPNAVGGQLHIDATDTTRFGVYSTGTVRKFLSGTRYRIGDRVYKYGKTDSATKAGFGAFNSGVFKAVTGGIVSIRSVGDVWVDILLDATIGGAAWFGTKNNMVGGFLSMPTGAPTMFRLITGHEKGANLATIKVYLDGPLTRATVATQFTEIAQNPYNQLVTPGGTFVSVMGVPTTVVVSGSFGWFQSWGPAWLNPDLPVSDVANWRTVVFVQGGGIRSFDDATGEAGHQVAGFVIDKGDSGQDNPPFIFLQISPF